MSRHQFVSGASESNILTKEILRRPHRQMAEEIIDRYQISELSLDMEGITGGVTDQPVDVSRDQLRAVLDRSRPFHAPGSWITLRVPYSGPTDILLLRTNTSTL